MDWTAALIRNRRLLLSLLVLLRGMMDACRSREVYARALRMLRPAESALRRLIVIAARDVSVAAEPARVFPEGIEFRTEGAGRPGCFALFDPRLRPAPPRVAKTSAPNIRFLDEPFEAPDVAPAANEAELSARLVQRVARFERALNDVGREARRLVRWRLNHPDDVRRPMRPGRPPGHRSRAWLRVDYALRDLQELALLSYADTS